jgi:hypothetical protein
MSATFCPHCNLVLSMRERNEGWCDTCGKKLPAFTTSSEPQRDEAPAAQPTQRRGFWVTFLLLLPCMAAGAGVALAITGGKTSGGFSGIMAAIGIGLGYAFRILPTKPSNSKATA